MIDKTTVYSALTVALLLLGVLAFLADQLLFAGLCLLATSFAIYLRETRA